MNKEALQEKLREHWQKVRIKNLDDLKKHVKELFEEHDDQSSVIIQLYRMVLPDLDKIWRVEGSPECGAELWLFIATQFQEFDQKHHPGALPGGAWVKAGFKINRNLTGTQISFENCDVTMK